MMMIPERRRDRRLYMYILSFSYIFSFHSCKYKYLCILFVYLCVRVTINYPWWWDLLGLCICKVTEALPQAVAVSKNTDIIVYYCKLSNLGYGPVPYSDELQWTLKRERLLFVSLVLVQVHITSSITITTNASIQFNPNQINSIQFNSTQPNS